jgi:hypothetical protein
LRTTITTIAIAEARKHESHAGRVEMMTMFVDGIVDNEMKSYGGKGRQDDQDKWGKSVTIRQEDRKGKQANKRVRWPK